MHSANRNEPMNVYIVRTSEDLGLRSKRRMHREMVITAATSEAAVALGLAAGLACTLESVRQIDTSTTGIALKSCS